MTDAAAAEKTAPDNETSVLVSTPAEDERLRVLIRKELDRQHAIPVARRTLELLAEAAMEPSTSSPGYRVVDRHGETRLRAAIVDTTPKKNRKTEKQADIPLVPFTLVDLVDELRKQHSDLFSAPPEPEPVPLPPAREPSHTVRDTVTGVRAAGARFMETQSALAKSLAAVSSKRGRAFAGLATRTFENWRRRLENRRASKRSVNVDSRSEKPVLAATDVPATKLDDQVSVAQPRRDWRSIAQGAVVRIRSGQSQLVGKFRRPSDGVTTAVSNDAGYRRVKRPIIIGLGGVLALALIVVVATFVRNEPTTAPPPPPATTAQKEAPDPSAKTTAPSSSPTAQNSPQGDPELQPSLEEPPSNPSDLTGVPEVVDTATLRLGGKTVRLFGVEWVRGGQAEELTKYLAGRKVTCQPAPGSSAYLCAVDGRDLSEVVLFNGGGRASSEATPDLAAAEDHARSERLGVWKR